MKKTCKTHRRKRDSPRLSLSLLYLLLPFLEQISADGRKKTLEVSRPWTNLPSEEAEITWKPSRRCVSGPFARRFSAQSSNLPSQNPNPTLLGHLIRLASAGGRIWAPSQL
ncbi:hypothetical protein ACLOJK_026332 [Asimina triloba]